MRLRGKGAHKQMVLTFNPVSVLHWLKLRFFDRKDPRALVLKSTYKDNSSWTRTTSAPWRLQGHGPYYYSVYCLGEWGVLGQTIFDAQKVTERLSQLAGPVKRGEFVFSTWYNSQSNEVLIDNSTIKWVDSPRGPSKSTRSRPQGRPTSSARTPPGRARTSTWARWYATQRPAGVHHPGPDGRGPFRQAAVLPGVTYNTALIAIEANFSSYPIRELERLRYPRQYVRQAEDSFTHRIRQSYGFKTSSVTRPLVIAGWWRWCGSIRSGSTTGTP